MAIAVRCATAKLGPSVSSSSSALLTMVGSRRTALCSDILDDNDPAGYRKCARSRDRSWLPGIRPQDTPFSSLGQRLPRLKVRNMYTGCIQSVLSDYRLSLTGAVLGVLRWLILLAVCTCAGLLACARYTHCSHFDALDCLLALARCCSLLLPGSQTSTVPSVTAERFCHR